MDMTQSMKHQVEVPIMQEKGWTRAFRQCNSWSTRARKSQRENDRAGRKSRSRGAEPPQASRPRPASLAYKWCPLGPIFCRQVTLSFLSLCAQVSVPRTTVDIASLPKLDSSNNSHL
jgi:hypothetical protein